MVRQNRSIDCDDATSAGFGTGRSSAPVAVTVAVASSCPASLAVGFRSAVACFSPTVFVKLYA